MKKVLIFTLFASCLISCQFINRVVRDDEVVARVGNKVLYKGEVSALIPDGIHGEDSLRLAIQYIDSWASDLVFLDVAESQLSKSDKDVTEELESYRRSLLKYRYEQHYINERLDTSVTDYEINKYYNSHKDLLVLKSPIVRARFVQISALSPALQQMKRLMSSENEDALWEAENLALTAAEMFKGYSDKWISLTTIAKDSGIDFDMLEKAKTGSFVETDNGGIKNIVYIIDAMQTGELAPLEYCTPDIADMIISSRKRQLTTALEQELLDVARDKGKYVIY